MLLFLLPLVKRRKNIKGAFSHAREHPLCAADSDKHTDPVRQYGDDAARDDDAEEDDRHGTLQAHIEHGGDERARPRAGARQRNGDKQQQPPRLIADNIYALCLRPRFKR